MRRAYKQICDFIKRQFTLHACSFFLKRHQHQGPGGGGGKTDQLNVLGHDRDALGVDGAQVGVLEQANQVSLSGLLEGQDSRALEAEIGLEVLSDFSDQALEGQLADEQLRALLVATDLAERHGTRAVAVRLYTIK